MYKHIFSLKAAKEYKEAISWYGERSEDVSERFITAVMQRINDVCSDPFRYRNMYRNAYETSVISFPFTLVYLVKRKDGIIIISSLYHHRRNPKKKYKR